MKYKMEDNSLDRAWEKHYDTNKPSKNMEITEGADFAPKKSKDRKKVYEKVNECDH